MKKKEQITLHKNLQSGKANFTQTRNTNNQILSNRAIIQKNQQKQNKKILSQQKVNLTKKRSSSKAENKQSRQMTSSIGKNQKAKSKRKTQSVKGSKKSLKRVVSEQDENSVTSARRNNIYTDGYKEKKEKQKKKANKYSERQSSSSAHEANQQNSIAQSITESIKSQSQRLQVDSLVNEIQQHEFANLHKLKLHMLNFIFRNRIIRDQQYDRLYELMVRKFPEREEMFKTILFEIVSSLDN